MSKQAADFVNELSQDPEKLERFKADPDAAMAGTDLSAEDKAVLRTKDAQKISSYLGEAGFAAALLIFDSK